MLIIESRASHKRSFVKVLQKIGFSERKNPLTPHNKHKHMEQEELYPNMDLICRLCLKENVGKVNIFPDQNRDNAGNHANMYIPMRIMACLALEVQTGDGLPKKICSECRYGLEKSYLFRKQSQASDAKLRKHIRLLSLGKCSKVFRKSADDDDDDDELEFYDSLEFIRLYEDKIKIEEQVKLENIEFKMKTKYDSEMEKYKAKLKEECKEELRSEVEQSVKNKLRQEIQEDVEKEMIPKIRIECLRDARNSLRDEVIEECRQQEFKSLLDDLQSYLNEKQTTRPDILGGGKVVLMQKIRPLSPTVKADISTAKRPRYIEISNKVEEESVNSAKKSNLSPVIIKHSAVIKPELILSDNQSEEDVNINDDDEGDSDNFLIYDTDDGFEIQKKIDDEVVEEDDDTIVEDHLRSYESSEDPTGCTNSQEDRNTSTISYRIEDTDSGEIKFLKKSTEISHLDVNEDNNDELLNDANIMIINYPSELDEEEHLDIVEYAEDDEVHRDGKNVVLKNQTIKHNKPKDTKNAGNISLNSDSYTTTATVQTTLMRKTFVNTVQRITDTPKIFKCNDCPTVFSTKHSLERHLRTHRKVEATGVTFQCPECHIVVSCSSALRRHMFIHCEEKPFVCKECGKSFVQKEILKRHMQTHTGVKPHKCPNCDRAFAQRINLQQHINRHHLVEPRIQQHPCHLCPKRFNHASGLSRHLASHSGVAFQCSECDRTFGDRSSIKRHIANKHGGGKVAKSEKFLEYN